jgi:hypothetical protein
MKAWSLDPVPHSVQGINPTFASQGRYSGRGGGGGPNWVRRNATSRKVAGSSPNKVNEFFLIYLMQAENTVVGFRQADYVAPLSANVGTNFVDKRR